MFSVKEVYYPLHKDRLLILYITNINKSIIIFITSLSISLFLYGSLFNFFLLNTLYENSSLHYCLFFHMIIKFKSQKYYDKGHWKYIRKRLKLNNTEREYKLNKNYEFNGEIIKGSTTVQISYTNEYEKSELSIFKNLVKELASPHRSLNLPFFFLPDREVR